MTDSRYARVKELLLRARALAPQQRAAFLDGACAGDDALRAEVESLLAHAQTPAAVLHSGALARDVDRALGELAPPATPDRIGPYRLVRVCGEGGMGRVYLAEQTEPVHRQVALKLIRGGLDSRGFIGRFEAERQILARLEHPGIARLIDGGVAPGGLPWFTMEFVDGVPLTQYCDQQRLPIEARLRLFRSVCAAVQYAHRNLVVHRDLKPGNILVTGEGRVKLLDFGIAKVVGGSTDEDPPPAALTRTESRLLTPEYAAPEQIRNQPVTTATDVYALGVILYELLCGARPHAGAGRTARDLEDAVLEAEPAPPSVAVLGGIAATPPAGIAAARSTEPGRLRRAIGGDLDAICLKALRKEPERRYASAEQLDEDLRRRLEGLPVLARRGAFSYRAGKFLRRHRGAVAAAAAVLLLLASVAGSYTVRLRQERDRARQAGAESEAVTTFLSDMLGAADPREQGREVTVAAVLDTAARAIEHDFAQSPAIAARLEATVGRAYYGLGNYDRAQQHMERAVRLRERLLGREAPGTLAALSALVPLYTDQGRFAEAESVTARLLGVRRRHLGDQHPDTRGSVNALADLRARQGHPAQAESLLLRALDGQTAPDRAPDFEARGSMGLLANLYADQSRFAEAETLYVKLLELRTRGEGAEHPLTLSIMNNLALLYMQTGRHREAEPLYKRTVDIRTRVQGPKHPDTVGSMYNLAVLYSDLGRFAESETLFDQVLASWRAEFGPENPRTLIATNNLARLYAKAGRLPAAEALYRQTLEARQRVLGPEHPSTLGTAVNLACAVRDQARHDEAERDLQSVWRVQCRVLGERHANTLNTLYQLAVAHRMQGQHERAVDELRRASDGVRATLGGGHRDWAHYSTTLAECLTALGRYAQAESLLLDVRDGALQALAPDDPQRQATSRALEGLYAVWHRK